jgi:short-subunit dehydrogenase
MRNPASLLVTGASSGIGAALAKAYARPGMRLALTGRNPERLSDVAGAARAAGATVIERALDIRDEGALASWIAAIDAAHPLDLVIANAGITGGHHGPGAEESLDEVRQLMEINFLAACVTVQAALGPMRRRKRGQVAVMSSIAGMRGLPYAPGYCASKAALIAYADSLRAFLRAEGIEVAIVLPGFIDTPMVARVIGPRPMMISSDRAAEIIRRGLERGKTRIGFPLPLYWLQRAAMLLPAAPVDMFLNRLSVTVTRYD